MAIEVEGVAHFSNPGAGEATGALSFLVSDSVCSEPVRLCCAVTAVTPASDSHRNTCAT